MEPQARSFPVLVVDDEQPTLDAFELTLLSGGIRDIILEQDSRNVIAILKKHTVDVVLLDLIMPHIGGRKLLGFLAEEFPEIPVIIVTGQNSLDTAIECMKAGAFDYLVKPVEKMRLIASVRRAREVRALARQNLALRQRVLSGVLEHPEAFAAIVTADPAMHALFQYVEAVAPSPEPVLISGETGVGKELFARALHALSGRTGHFVAVNIAGLDDTVFADTLFGHKKGAFTGADAGRPGLVSQSAGGTLFLDEIGDLGVNAQVKLLRLLQEKEYYPLGSDVAQLAEARIILSTNRDLEAMVESGQFRKDLFYRLKTHYFHVPPLRERPDDIPLLFGHFLQRAAARFERPAPDIGPDLPRKLRCHEFPGNIRELEALATDLVARHREGPLTLDSLHSAAKALSGAGEDGADTEKGNIFRHLAVLPSLRESGRQLVAEAMRRAGGNQRVAAGFLGISQPALSKRLKGGEL